MTESTGVRIPFADLASWVGQEGLITLGGLSILVRVHKATLTNGKLRFEVYPVGGSGMKWVDAKRVRLIPEEYR